MVTTIESKTISVEAATELVDMCREKANDLGRPMAIAVCDHAGELKVFSRMDGAPLLAVQIAQDKAFTAVSFGLSTDQWYDFIKDDGPLALGIVHTPRLVVFGGGFPLYAGRDLVGGIGISGGHYTEDMACARAAIEGSKLRFELEETG